MINPERNLPQEPEADFDDIGREASELGPYEFEGIESNDIIGLYFKEAGKVPLLTAQEEVVLAKKMEAGKKARGERSQPGLSLEKRQELQDVINDGWEARGHLIKANARLV